MNKDMQKFIVWSLSFFCCFYVLVSLGAEHDEPNKLNDQIEASKQMLQGYVQCFNAEPEACATELQANNIERPLEASLIQTLLNTYRTHIDREQLIRMLDPKQRQVVQLFRKYAVATSKQIARFLGLNQRTASALCKKWVEQGFLNIVDPSYKARTYTLAEPYDSLLF